MEQHFSLVVRERGDEGVPRLRRDLDRLGPGADVVCRRHGAAAEFIVVEPELVSEPMDVPVVHTPSASPPARTKEVPRSARRRRVGVCGAGKSSCPGRTNLTYALL